MYFKTLSTQLQQFASKFTFLFRVSVRYEHTAKMHTFLDYLSSEKPLIASHYEVGNWQGCV